LFRTICVEIVTSDKHIYLTYCVLTEQWMDLDWKHVATRSVSAVH